MKGSNAEPDLELIDFLPADNFTKDPVHAKISALLAWHMEDTVDAFEYNRNNVIYGYQKNRNPFIDHPEYVDMIWGSDTIPDPTSIDEHASAKAEPQVLLIYPNPVNEQATIIFPNPDNTEYQLLLRDMSGRIRRISNNLQGESISFTRGDLSPGIYFLELRGAKYYRAKIIIK